MIPWWTLIPAFIGGAFFGMLLAVLAAAERDGDDR